MDDRLVAMIAQIVEAYGRYTSSRGPSYSSYQALKAMGLDELEGRLLAGLLAPHGDDPTPDPGADRQSPCRPEDSAAAAVGGERDQTAHRRAARPRPRADVRHPAAGRERGVPAGLRRPVAPDAQGRSRRWPGCWRPGWRPSAGATAPGRSTCARRCASRCPPAGCRSMWCCASRGRPAGARGALRRIGLGGRLQPLHPCCWCMRCANSSPGFGCSPSSTPPTR